MKSCCKVKVPIFDPQTDLIQDTIDELRLLAEMGFNEADLIYSFCSVNNMLGVIRHLPARKRNSLVQFTDILRERYSDSPHSAAVRFNSYEPPPKTDKQDTFNHIVKLYRNMVSDHRSTSIDQAGFNRINEKFLSTIA